MAKRVDIQAVVETDDELDERLLVRARDLVSDTLAGAGLEVVRASFTAADHEEVPYPRKQPLYGS